MYMRKTEHLIPETVYDDEYIKGWAHFLDQPVQVIRDFLSRRGAHAVSTCGQLEFNFEKEEKEICTRTDKE